ncbi:MAG: SGNH/GDSL hydrolase family protein [Chloroflexi bacterium]|nr:SGNH/GDSL hydrolase family protein [Chloroflexota bacterium]
MRMLALGDSYTIGTGSSPADRWAVQIGVLLNTHGFKLEPPDIIAANGWTTVDLQRAIAAATLTPSYDLVTLLIGVNDQYDGLGPERYQDGFTSLLQIAIGLTSGQAEHVIVLSIPDYSVTPFAQSMDTEAIRSEIAAFNVINHQLSIEAAAQYVDLGVSSQHAIQDPALLADDGLHPSGKMYALWAHIILPFAEEILSHKT